MNYSKNLFIFVLIIFISFLLIESIPLSPDEQVADITSNNLEFYGPYIKLDNNSLADLGYATFPLGLNYNEINDNVYATTFPGYIYFLSYFKQTGISPYFSSILVFIILIILTYLLAKNIFSKHISILLAILVSISPIFIHWSLLNYLDIFSLFLLVFSVYLILKYKNILSINLISGILVGLWIFSRYTNAIFLPIFILLFYDELKARKFRCFLIFSLGILAVLIPMFYFNYIHYNALITIPDTVNTGNEFNYVSIFVLTGNIILRFLTGSSELLLNTINVSFLGLFLIFSILFALKYAKKEGNDKLRILTMILLYFLFVGIFFFYSGQKQFYNQSPHYSFYRYILPVFYFGTILSGFYISKLNKFFKILIVSLISILLIINSCTSNYSLLYVHNQKIYYQELKNELMHLTPENSIIITDFYGKIVYPSRKIVSTNFNLSKENVTKEKFSELFFHLKPNIISKQLFILTTNNEELNKRLDFIPREFSIELLSSKKNKFGGHDLYLVNYDEKK